MAKLVAQKKSLTEIIAAKPTADLDATWGQGMIKPDLFVTLIVKTLPQRK